MTHYPVTTRIGIALAKLALVLGIVHSTDNLGQAQVKPCLA